MKSCNNPREARPVITNNARIYYCFKCFNNKNTSVIMFAFITRTASLFFLLYSVSFYYFGKKLKVLSSEPCSRQNLGTLSSPCCMMYNTLLRCLQEQSGNLPLSPETEAKFICSFYSIMSRWNRCGVAQSSLRVDSSMNINV